MKFRTFHNQRLVRVLLSGWLLMVGTVFCASAGSPWLFGVQREPRWALAVGSGRLKVWWAERGAFAPHETWTASCYRGLDGQSLRWDVSAVNLGSVRAIAVPLWPAAGLLLALTLYAWRPLPGRSDQRCIVCGYSRAGLPAACACPECGSPA